MFDYYDASRRHELPCGTHLEEVISRAKFDVSTPSCFGGVKIDRQTHKLNCALYTRCNWKASWIANMALPIASLKATLKLRE